MENLNIMPNVVRRLALSGKAQWVISTLAALMLSWWALAPAHAIIIDGLNADKQTFLAYLINQGASGNGAAFAYAGPNANQDGPADLIAGAGATNNFGARMATAAGAINNGLTVHVGRNIPRIFFGAFRWDPAVGGNQAGHQTIDLADILAVPVRHPNNLEGGADIILHEIFEGIVGLGSNFNAAHFNSGFQEENSNRAADNSKGIRVVPQPRTDSLVVNAATGDVTFRTAWRINNVPPRNGDLVILGRLVGGANYTVNSIQFGLLPAGDDDGTRFDVQFVDQFFVDVRSVPEPGSLPIVLAGIGIAATMCWRRRSKR